MSEGAVITLVIAIASLIFNIIQFRSKNKETRTGLELGVEAKRIETQSNMDLARLSQGDRFIQELQKDAQTLRDVVRQLEDVKVKDRARIDELAESCLGLKLENTRLMAENIELDEERQAEAKLRETIEDRIKYLAHILEANKIKY